MVAGNKTGHCDQGDRAVDRNSSTDGETGEVNAGSNKASGRFEHLKTGRAIPNLNQSGSGVVGNRLPSRIPGNQESNKSAHSSAESAKNSNSQNANSSFETDESRKADSSQIDIVDSTSVRSENFEADAARSLFGESATRTDLAMLRAAVDRWELGVHWPIEKTARELLAAIGTREMTPHEMAVAKLLQMLSSDDIKTQAVAMSLMLRMNQQNAALNIAQARIIPRGRGPVPAESLPVPEELMDRPALSSDDADDVEFVFNLPSGGNRLRGNA